jgi:carboxy-terminal domain RNA polymerase II polypeptide A small phosphatase
MAAAAVEVTPVQHRGQAAAAAWQVVTGWLGTLVQILLQIIRRTPSSWARLLSFLGVRQPLLPSTAQPQPSPEVAFVQLPSEAPADASPPPLRRLTVRTPSVRLLGGSLVRLVV